MTQEQKDKLLKYLCMALPYGVKFLRESWNYEWDQEMSVVETLEDIDNKGYINHTRVYKVEDIKPYLRPMSSMTEEEKVEYFGNRMTPWAQNEFGESYTEAVMQYRIDFLLEHHFDYCGLIDKGIAIEVTKENNPYKD